MLNALDLSLALSVCSTSPTRFNALTNLFIDVQTTTRSLSKTISMRMLCNARHLRGRLKRKINKHKRVRSPAMRLIVEISKLFRTLKQHQSCENSISAKSLIIKKEISWMSSDRDSGKTKLKYKVVINFSTVRSSKIAT
jgi:hypothetical protein